MHTKLLQSCPTLQPMDCSPPGSSVHGILQARILEWVAMSFSRGYSWPRDWTSISCVSCIGRQVLTTSIKWKLALTSFSVPRVNSNRSLLLGHILCNYSVNLLMYACCCVLCALVAQSCLTLRNNMDCSLPGSSVHGILQERILE